MRLSPLGLVLVAVLALGCQAGGSDQPPPAPPSAPADLAAACTPVADGGMAFASDNCGGCGPCPTRPSTHGPGSYQEMCCLEYVAGVGSDVRPTCIDYE